MLDLLLGKTKLLRVASSAEIPMPGILPETERTLHQLLFCKAELVSSLEWLSSPGPSCPGQWLELPSPGAFNRCVDVVPRDMS